MSDRADEARLAGTGNSVAHLGVHTVRADHHVGVSDGPVAESQMRGGAIRFHINEPFAELDCSGLHLFQYCGMQIVAVNGDVTGAVFLLARIAERQLEQDLAGVPLAAGELVRVDADLAQSMFGAEMAQHLHDIR